MITPCTKTTNNNEDEIEVTEVGILDATNSTSSTTTSSTTTIYDSSTSTRRTTTARRVLSFILFLAGVSCLLFAAGVVFRSSETSSTLASTSMSNHNTKRNVADTTSATAVITSNTLTRIAGRHLGDEVDFGPLHLSSDMSQCMVATSRSNSLDVKDVKLAPCSGSDNELWDFEMLTGGMRLRNKAFYTDIFRNDLCLDMLSLLGSYNVVLSKCNGRESQRWIFTQYSSGNSDDYESFHLKNVGRGACVSVEENRNIYGDWSIC